ncbi:MAG: trehalose-phosphatase [Candidatus Caldatribacteriota bacterium]|nr:trehalose-phosphatase [Candidatus Caldatribacteriota bacterium]
MHKNNLKAMIFQLNKSNQSDSRYQQFIQFTKHLNRPDIKIGLILPDQTNTSFDVKIDPLMQAAMSLGIPPSETMIFLSQSEDIRISRDNGFALIAGWKSTANEDKLLFQKGADILIGKLDLLNPKWIDYWFNHHPTQLFESKKYFPAETEGLSINPHYLYTGPEIMKRKEKPVFFFDYDGTLTPIVQRPSLAKLASSMKNILLQLSKKYHLALISGREREDLIDQVGIPDIFYAGNHGLDINGPGISMTFPLVKKYLPIIENISHHLDQALSSIPGVILEKKKMSVAIHYRMVSIEDLPELKSILKNSLKGKLKHIRILKGKKVFEFLPNIGWNKGKAIIWMMNIMKLSWSDHRVFFLGDDTTDEDAFRILRTRGTGILIAEKARISAADYRLSSPEEVKNWMQCFLD